MPRFLLSAGDPSGDLLASELVLGLKKHYGLNCQISSIGGPRLKNTSDFFIEDLSKQGLMGWIAPVMKIPYLWRLFKKLDGVLQKERFDCFIPVDFYGFNIRLAKLAKKYGIPVIYYVSPQIWASRASRIQKIKSYVDKVLCLFPFEAELYRSQGVEAHFVGHPLMAKLKPLDRSWKLEDACLPARQGEWKIGLLPGSRKTEVQRHWPIVFGVWKKIRKSFPGARAHLFKNKEIPECYPPEELLSREGITSSWGPDYQSRSGLDLAITASGLAALENMLLGIAMVVFYSVKPGWFYWALHFVVKTPYIAMPNILAQRKIVEEIHWADFSWNRKRAIEALTKNSLDLLANTDKRQKSILDLRKLRETLMAPHGKNPIDLATEEIEETIHVKTGSQVSNVQV